MNDQFEMLMKEIVPTYLDTEAYIVSIRKRRTILATSN